MTVKDADEPLAFETRRRWFLRGIRAAFSLPFLILGISYVGFAGLAAESGITLPQALLMTVAVWALPTNVVLIGAILSGSSVSSTALAAGLSAVRLMPMAVTLVPEMRGPRTRRWALILLSHFVAVTSWIIAMERLRGIPVAARTTYYAGLGSTLLAGCAVIVAITYSFVDHLPPALNAALFLLTPMYFLTSLWGVARERAGNVAMVLGLVAGPVCHALLPALDLLAAGLISGLAAFALHRFDASRRPR